MVAVLLAVAAASDPYQPRPSYHPRPAHHQPSYDEPPKYDFSYDVHGYSDYDAKFNAQEARDGYATQGSYSVDLPDGRTQTVTYRVDDAYSGTIADVTYEGEAQYPAHQPSYQPSHRPSYHQPSYRPSYKPAYGN